ncbi:MAG: hypothetical protein COT24_02210 [Candidatus Kerfeldbacteria bacterium CG08_land_8_20_14_0_20_40_16]|uniref:DUF5666 domain-containing protein n=1 Tax=Candidatus Kerfeldbacteria bacterium CG08_land_8_20_14_0_20_40_16 TaxID=2014244 RepID=A0A2H0YW32_9BACT|nr:MAG: hypothetical protein COT24_02210 [Candidatus Kerfeldbacteria bacterium CG08_land_8_20_14_0_20_40_16]
MKKFAFLTGIALAVLVSANIAWAVQNYNDGIAVPYLKVGSQGVGGVTFFNGTIINETTNSGVDNPVTFGDNVRIDGTIFRGATEGPGDDYPIKLNDDVRIYGDLTLEGSVTGLDSSALSDVASVAMLDEAETITGNWDNTTNPWAASEIADITRQVNIPLASLYTDAAGTPTAITSATTPALTYTANQGLAIVYAEDDTADFGGQFIVPSDYTSGGVIKALIDTSGGIVNDWNLDFKVAISSSTGTPAWDTDMDDETVVDVPDSAGTPDVVTFTPTDQAALTGGANVYFDLFPDSNTATGEPNLEIYSVWFEYTAIQ